MSTTRKSEFKHPLKTCAVGLAVMTLAFSTPGFCDKKRGDEDRVRQVLKELVEMPTPTQSDQVGPHPADPAYQKFTQKIEKIVKEEKAAERKFAARKHRIQALDD